MIPAEAVEAAAKMIYSDGWDGAPYWESMADDNSDKIHHRAIAQKVLEAAAPYIVARAFRGAADQLEYGNPINEWLYELADVLEEKNAE